MTYESSCLHLPPVYKMHMCPYSQTNLTFPWTDSPPSPLSLSHTRPFHFFISLIRLLPWIACSSSKDLFTLIIDSEKVPFTGGEKKAFWHLVKVAK